MEKKIQNDELFEELSVNELEDRLELVDRCTCRNEETTVEEG